MKKLILFLTILISTMSCEKNEVSVKDTTLDLKITEQPTGGTEVFTATVSFIGTIQGLVKPVDVSVKWYKETKANAAQQLAQEEIYTFTQGNSIAKSSTIRIISVYPSVSNYYWAVISWIDGKGKSHQLQTNKVLCTTEKEF